MEARSGVDAIGNTKPDATRDNVAPTERQRHRFGSKVACTNPWRGAAAPLGSHYREPGHERSWRRSSPPTATCNPRDNPLAPGTSGAKCTVHCQAAEPRQMRGKREDHRKNTPTYRAQDQLRHRRRVEVPPNERFQAGMRDDRLRKRARARARAKGHRKSKRETSVPTNIARSKTRFIGAGGRVDGGPDVRQNFRPKGKAGLKANPLQGRGNSWRDRLHGGRTHRAERCNVDPKHGRRWRRELAQ